MTTLFERCAKAALNFVKPYSSSREPPSAHVWTYIKSHVSVLRSVLLISAFITVVTAGIEVWLIAYAGQLIDALAATPRSEIWQSYGPELVGAALVVLVLRPVCQFIRHLVNEIGFQCNSATLFRWRAHDHLSKQSVGWFQEDLTGRTATTIGGYR